MGRAQLAAAAAAAPAAVAALPVECSLEFPIVY